MRNTKSGVLFNAIMVLLFSSLHVWAEDVTSRKVLVIYPDMAGRPGIIEFDQAFRQYLLEHSKQKIEFYYEFLDAVRFPDQKYQEQLAKFLQQKYATIKLETVVVGLKHSFNFFKNYQKSLPDVPVVFAAIEENELSSEKLPDNMVGVPMKFDSEATMQMALGIHPDARRVYVVSGSSTYDKYWKEKADQNFSRVAPQLEIVHLADLSIHDLLDKVSKIGAGSFIYYLHLQKDNTGASYAAPEVLSMMKKVARVPIYGHLQVYHCKGIVGGKLMSFANEGKNAAWLVNRMLQGESPRGIVHRGEVQNSILIDGQEYQRWATSHSQLPVGVIIDNEQPGVWELYRWQIVGALALLLAQTLLIAGLLLQRSSRQQAENQFRLSVDASPYGMLMVERNGRIVLVNAQMEKMFGYGKSEFQQIPLEHLVPIPWQIHHEQWREQFFQSPLARPMGKERELFARRKDGSEFPVEIGLNPIRSNGKTLVLATIVDISERKIAASRLEQSQEELTALTGKLLTAQETESRRIARELHDDLNQNLALIAVELDMLAHSKEVDTQEFAERTRELSIKVKQLSTFVHNLSHQLHPAKLEQLGLIKSLRSLCRELSSTHDVVIDYDIEELDFSLPVNTSLCFYRIAQEALNNAIKHADAEIIEVQLKSMDHHLVMTIQDDGRGFDPESSNEKPGLGLLSMRERVRLVQGSVQLSAKPGKGTRIEVRVPFEMTTQESISSNEQLEYSPEPAERT
ncbi:MAG: PAS domain S-box protein [Planctomycetia bacterium]|nr:PAS domain S-box protein [Planctomycetia bacterium]